MTGESRVSWPRGLESAARGLAATAAAVAMLVAFVVVGILLASGDEEGGTSPASVVPADALAYVELDADPASAAGEGARRIARALPMLSRQVLGRLGAGLPALRAAGLKPGGTRPAWLGDSAAVAVTGGAAAPAAVELLGAADDSGANAFARRLIGGRATASTYRGTRIRSDRGASAAIAGGFLVYGPTAQVKRVIDTEIGDGSALSGDAGFVAATDGLPGGWLARGYVSPAGASLLRGSPLAFLTPLAAGTGVQGVALALTATDNSIAATARSAFEPQAGSRPPLAGLQTFAAKLPETLPANTLAYAGAGSSGSALRASLGGLGGLGNAISAAFLALLPKHSERALASLGSALGRESAVVVQAPGGGVRPATEPPSPGLVSTGVDPDAARVALSRHAARGLLGRVTGTTLRVAANRGELAALTRPRGSLDTTAGFSNAMVGFSTSPSLEAYLDVESLVPIFEAAGLAENPAYASFATEIRRLRALGVVVSSQDGAVTVQARLTLATGGSSALGPD